MRLELEGGEGGVRQRDGRLGIDDGEVDEEVYSKTLVKQLHRIAPVIV